MPSQYKENYLYYAGNKEVKTILIHGKNKKDTDEKFRDFLIDFNTNRHDTPLLKDFINERYRKTFLPKLSPTTQVHYKLMLDKYIIPYLGDQEMGKITVPVLLMTGENDTTNPPEKGAAVAGALPDAEFHIVPHAKHIAWRRNPQRVFQLIDGFLAEGKGR